MKGQEEKSKLAADFCGNGPALTEAEVNAIREPCHSRARRQNPPKDGSVWVEL
jgi:hypothetical protein